MKSRDTTRITSVKSIQFAVQQEFQDYKVYPNSDTAVGSGASDIANCTVTEIST
jgi:hypothetical protein